MEHCANKYNEAQYEICRFNLCGHDDIVRQCLCFPSMPCCLTGLWSVCRSAGLEDPRGPDASTQRRDQVLAQRGQGVYTDLSF